MLKKLFAGNSLLTSVIALVGAVLMMAAVGFAWWSLSNQAQTDSFVNTVGNLEIDYTFKQFTDGEVSGPLTMASEVDFANAIPGDTYSFVIIVENIGNVDGLSSIYMYNVNSLIYDNVDGWIVLDLLETKRIQNAFNYEVLDIRYLTDTSDLALEGIYSLLSSPNDKHYFTQATDRYFLIENETLEIAGTSSVIAVFFNITYEGLGFDNNDYVGQRFDINKIIIECR